MSANESSVIARVRALLAKTEERGATEAEAAAAAEKAQVLMLQYGIELAQLAEAKGGGLGVKCEAFEGKLDPWRRVLAAGVAKASGGTFLFLRAGGGKWSGRLEFWGERGTTAGMVATYQYLEAQLQAIVAIEAAVHVKATGPFQSAALSMRWRRSFLYGAASRVAGRLRERREQVERNADNSKALVVLNNAVDQAIKDKYQRIKRESSNVSLDPHAERRGRAAGERVDLGGKKVRDRKKELAR